MKIHFSSCVVAIHTNHPVPLPDERCKRVAAASLAYDTSFDVKPHILYIACRRRIDNIERSVFPCIVSKFSANLDR